MIKNQNYISSSIHLHSVKIMVKKYINIAAISVQGQSTKDQRQRDYLAICNTTSRGRSHASDGLQFNYSRTTSRGKSHGFRGLQFKL